MSIHIAHMLIFGWFFKTNSATISQIIGHRETFTVFCFYSSHGRKPYFALICRIKCNETFTALSDSRAYSIFI